MSFHPSLSVAERGCAGYVFEARRGTGPGQRMGGVYRDSNRRGGHKRQMSMSTADLDRSIFLWLRRTLRVRDYDPSRGIGWELGQATCRAHQPEPGDAVSTAYVTWYNSRAYATASIVTSERIVFNVKGNSYRLVVAVDFEKGIVWIKWIGTHLDYDSVDVKGINHGR
jgi:hypothetical protein